MHTPEASSNHQQQTNSTAWKLPAWEKMIEICNSNRNPLSVSNHVPKCTVFPKKKQDRINHQSFYLSSHFLYIDVYCTVYLVDKSLKPAMPCQDLVPPAGHFSIFCSRCTAATPLTYINACWQGSSWIEHHAPHKNQANLEKHPTFATKVSTNLKWFSRASLS